MGLPKYDVETARKMIHAFVPISRFNKGEAGKIIEEVKEDGIRVIVKNNVPECIMISVEEYDRSIQQKNNLLDLVVNRSKEEDEKRKAFIARIRKNVSAPIPPTADREEVMNRIGPIYVDEEAVNELRRISMI